MKLLPLLLLALLIPGCMKRHHYKKISLQSTGKLLVEPDEAGLTLRLSCLDKDILKARECITAKSARLLATLNNFKLKKENIHTSRLDLSKKHTRIDQQQVLEGYKASITVDLLLHDLGMLDSLYTKLIVNENLEIRGLTFSHSKIDSLHNSALKMGIENSKKSIEKMLESLPESGYKIIKVSNFDRTHKRGGSSEYAYAPSSFAGGRKSKSVVSINIGKLSVHETVYIYYKIY